MKEDIKNSLIKYITGQADETESAEVREWIKSTPGNEENYFQLYEAWHNSLYANKEIFDVDDAYETFLHRIAGKKPLYKRLSFWTRLSSAAIIILMCSIGYFQYNKFKRSEILVALEVPKGMTKKIILPDGSIVWVNAGSQISYSKDFGKQNRTIFLKGEAYFDIAKSDTEIPFLVKAGIYTIRDIGTVFNVKAYPDELFETTVVEGKVSVEGKLTEGSDEEGKVFLDVNQVLKINRISNTNKKKDLDLEPLKVVQIENSQINEYNGWKEDLLIFDGDTFEEIAKILERRYNVSIVFADDEFKKIQYSGTFKKLENISKVFNVIKETTPLEYNLANGVIIIKKPN
ncbi:FecR family protein [Pedobacter sp. P351]|uniref:FecR family protein n=1 Tax=Pedobacter superstes TaxID=3133441 RepID=UPI0030A52F24